MAKELPYFKFQPSEWVTGDITLCSMEAQGLFINLCCFYWIKDCSISLTNAQQRFSNHVTSLEELLSKEIIKVNSDNKIIIEFLDEQMQKFSDISAKRSKSGSMRAQANAKQMQSKCKANANILRDRERDREDINIPFEIFWDSYGRKEGDKSACIKKWHKLKDEDRQKIIDTLPVFLSKIKDKQFQPYPATYLNQQRWNDEVAIPAVSDYQMP
ncbi:MAG TPA: hypothetical protein PLF27_11810 [Sedimentibacter sp.]|nr:hypothetical protein [Sedimentibacter sp.]